MKKIIPFHLQKAPINLVKMLNTEMNKLDINLINSNKAYYVFDTEINIKKNIISKAKKTTMTP